MCVMIAGVPVNGTVDTAADISIIGPEAFKRVAAVAKLKKRDLKPADKTPRTYHHTTFHLDGRLDRDVSFQGRTTKTPIDVRRMARSSFSNVKV